MANMLCANQAVKATYRPISLLTSAKNNDIDAYQAFVPGTSSGSIEALHCQFYGCHQNFHHTLDVDNYQYLPSSPTHHQVCSAPILDHPVIQGDVIMEESSNINNANSSLRHINAQMFNSPGVSIALTKCVMARATQMWVLNNKKNDGESSSTTTIITISIGNKRKKSWDEYGAEEYEKEQPKILANQFEWTLNMRPENKKNKKIMKNEKEEKQDVFLMCLNNKNKAIRKLNRARAGESSSSEDHNHPN